MRDPNDFLLIMPSDHRQVWFSEMDECDLRECVKVLRSQIEWLKRDRQEAVDFATDVIRISYPRSWLSRLFG